MGAKTWVAVELNCLAALTKDFSKLALKFICGQNDKVYNSYILFLNCKQGEQEHSIGCPRWLTETLNYPCKKETVR